MNESFPDRYKLYWGETHDNTYQAPDPDFSMEEHLKRAAGHLDFYCGAYYPSSSPAFKKGGHPSQDKGRQPLNVESWKPAGQIGREWEEVKRAIAAVHQEGSFVVFPGFEWQGDGTWGDHNVFFNEDDPSLIRVDTLPELYKLLQSRRALAIPHHTAYIRGFRGKNWDFLDEKLSPFMEIFSIHGSSEGAAFGGSLRSNPFLGPDEEGGSLSRALLRGHKVGIIASTDNWGPLPGHYGRGLAAAWAESLSREGLWEAFTSRRVYGVTGDRIGLQFNLEDHPMGSILPRPEKKPAFRVQVDGLDRIDYIDFIRDEVLIDRVSPLDNPGAGGRLPGGGLSGDGLSGDEYLLRIEYGWGPGENVLTLPPKQWEGTLRIAGGELTGASPCFISSGQGISLQGGECSFGGSVSQETVGSPVQNGFVLSFRAGRESSLHIEIDGVSFDRQAGQMIDESRVLWNREAAAAMIRDQFQVDPELLKRKDVLFGMAYKAKIHPLVPASLCRREVTFTDHLYDHRPHSYRVRVRQRNGQLAWSSPIWLT